MDRVKTRQEGLEATCQPEVYIKAQRQDEKQAQSLIDQMRLLACAV